MTDVRAIIPGGIKPTDHIHVVTYDGTCSRCRKAIQEDEVPLLLWIPPKGNLMLAYCNACMGWDTPDMRLFDDEGEL